MFAIAMLVLVGFGSCHHFGVVEGLSLTAALYLLMPHPFIYITGKNK